MRTFQCLLPILAWILTSCEPNEIFPKANTTGSSTDTPQFSNALRLEPVNWRFYVGDIGNQDNPNVYQHTLTTGPSTMSRPFSNTGLVSVFSQTTSYTLGMSASIVRDTSSYCYWAYSFFPPTTLRVGKSLVLKAKVKLQQVQGPGVSLVLRGDRGAQSSILFATTEGRTAIRGTADFAEYSVSLPYTSSVDQLAIYVVMLANTTGSITVSDVSLQVD